MNLSVRLSLPYLSIRHGLTFWKGIKPLSGIGGHMGQRATKDSESVVYVNGRFYPKSQARISPTDHGILYGDGVFDTCTAHNGMIWRLDDHIDRFFMSAKAVSITIPLEKRELKGVVVETVRRNGLSDAYIKMYCTRGDGPPFINPAGTTGPTMVVFAVPPARVYSEEERMKGVRAIISSVRRIPPACGVEARIKQLNYMNNVLMYLEAMNAGADMAIALDLNGYVTEGIAQNIFVVRNSVIRTPPLQLILAGITRRSVIELAGKEGYGVVEEMLTPYDLYTADEVFATATAASGGGGLTAITNVDGRVIGGGKTGPVTDRLMKAHLQALRSDTKYLTPIYEPL